MEKVLEQFGQILHDLEIKALHIGHINDTFIVGNQQHPHGAYLLQRINHSIFKDVEGLQRNIQLVTDHLREKYQSAGISDTRNKVLQLIPAKDQKTYVRDEDGNFWRMYVYIDDAKSVDAMDPSLARKAGKAYGKFHRMLSDMPAARLVETIPNFHNMEFRLMEFRNAVVADMAGRVSQVEDLIEQIESRAEEMCLPQRLYRAGKLPKRITHCDTKVNNLLFDRNGEPTCIVDLDTVMPGFVMSDFGDFMRTGACTAAEDEADLDKIKFSQVIFRSFSDGYISEMKNQLEPAEIQLLPFGAKLLTYMQAVRFLTDFLNGDRYYKVNYTGHNLIRARAQFRLLEEIENNFSEMNFYIKQLICN